MKALVKIGIPGALLLIAAFFTSEKANAQSPYAISYQTFYNELSPYGRWISTPEYGYIWLPDVEHGFQPYSTRGHWVMTEYGNTWVSDYSWGWAPFHYGRWYYDNYFGWAWVPGTEWGPAWVSWRSGGGYYGWAPLSPGLNIHVSVIPAHHWVFVPQMYITSPRIYSYYVPRRRVVNVYHTTVIVNNYHTTNNYTYVSGPSRIEVERATRSRVRVHNIQQVDRPGRSHVNNGVVNVYRPLVRENTRTAARPTTEHASAGAGRNSRTSVDRSRNSNSVSNNSDIRRSQYNSNAPSTSRTPETTEVRSPQEAGRNYGNSRSYSGTPSKRSSSGEVSKPSQSAPARSREYVGTNYGSSKRSAQVEQNQRYNSGVLSREATNSNRTSVRTERNTTQQSQRMAPKPSQTNSREQVQRSSSQRAAGTQGASTQSRSQSVPSGRETARTRRN